MLVTETFEGSFTESLVELESGTGVFAVDKEFDESTHMIATVSIDGGAVKFRRALTVSVYKPAVGSSLDSQDGASLLLPPSSNLGEMLITGESSLGWSLPESLPVHSPVSEQWIVTSPVSDWGLNGELSLPYNLLEVVSGQEQGLAIWRLNDNVWERLDSYVDVNSGRVHSSTSKGGTFAIFQEFTSDEQTPYLPSQTALGDNWPNPFNPSTVIPFSLSKAGMTEVFVYNVMGQKVATIASGWHTAGQHIVNWNSHSSNGVAVASGIYFYQLRHVPADGTSVTVETRKLVLMR